MRKRWKISDGFVAALFGIWALGWIPIFIATWALTTPCDRTGACGLGAQGQGWIPAKIFLATWFGILVFPSVVAALAGFVAFLWRERPRRLVEPVTEDLREVRR